MVLRGRRFAPQRRVGTELPGLGKPGALNRRPYPPGQHAAKHHRMTDYARQLAEKKKILLHYELTDRQLLRYIQESKRGTGHNWIAKLIELLEIRLDNIVFRLGFAPSIRSARQLVRHGHVRVSGRKQTLGSIALRIGSEITLTPIGESISQSFPRAGHLPLASFLKKEVHDKHVVGTIIALPGFGDVPFEFDANLFVGATRGYKKR